MEVHFGDKDPRVDPAETVRKMRELGVPDIKNIKSDDILEMVCKIDDNLAEIKRTVTISNEIKKSLIKEIHNRGVTGTKTHTVTKGSVDLEDYEFLKTFDFPKLIIEDKKAIFINVKRRK